MKIGESVVLVGLLAAATALRLVRLDAGLWFDELDTLVHHVARPWLEIVTTYESQNQHLFYSLAARLVTRIFGESAWALRMPAVIFGVASIGATYAFGRRVASRREALLAAALLTFSHQHVWFSQNARGYTTLLFFVLIASGWLLDLLRGSSGSRTARTIGYAAAMALATYTHLTALAVLAAHAAIAAAVLLRRRLEPSPTAGRAPATAGWAPATALGLAGLLAALLYLPVLAQVVSTLTSPGVPVAGAVKWQSVRWMVSETVVGLARGLPGGVAGAVLAGVVLVAGAVSYGRESRVVLGLLVLPALVTAGVIVAAGHNLWPRLFFFSAGFGALMAVRGVFVLAGAVLPRRRIALGTAVVALLVAASATSVPAAWGPKQRYDEAWRFVEAARGPDDAVVTLLMSDLPYRDRPERIPIVTDDVDALDCLARRHPRVWVIRSFPTRVAAAQPRVWERLELDYRKVAEFPASVRDGEIVVLRSEGALPSRGTDEGQSHPSCD